ncbi:lysoplasmalogenase [Luedemannella helvata]|uniref:Lysoplasmalogenase n=1 Tax=Luedemannella helvata TaxID=349315 RepID=A0ABP4VVH3_9ACTN
MRDRLSRPLLVLFWAVAVAHLVALAAPAGGLAYVTKALLMPSLAAWALTRRAPGLLVAGLLCSAAGDVLLEHEGLFIAGMAAFAAAHVCYVILFVRRGAVVAARRRWAVVAAYALVWLALIVVMWPGLGDLRIPVAAYSLLLTATATLGAGLGLGVGVGGALFFVSDTLIAMRLADLPRPPGVDLLVMATYIGAQWLIASGVVARTPRPTTMG